MKTLKKNIFHQKIMDKKFEPGSDDLCQRFVLYTMARCSNSREIIKLAQERAPGDVYVQDISSLDSIPEWLNGVPIIADKNTMEIYRGTHAFDFLRNYNAIKHPHRAISKFSKDIYTENLPPVTEDEDNGINLKQKLDAFMKEREKAVQFFEQKA